MVSSATSREKRKRLGYGLGDRLNVRALPTDEIGSGNSLGQAASARAERFLSRWSAAARNTQRRSRRGATMSERTGLDLLVVLAGKVAAIVLVVIVSALFLIRPTPLSGSLALSALGSFALGPEFYMFLSGGAFLALIILHKRFFSRPVRLDILHSRFSLGRLGARGILASCRSLCNFYVVR